MFFITVTIVRLPMYVFMIFFSYRPFLLLQHKNGNMKAEKEENTLTLY